MLTSMVVVAPDGAGWPNLEIKLAPGAGEPLVLLGITGLEPVGATITTKTHAAGNGEFATGSTLPKRNIVARLGLLTANARDTVYSYFLPRNAIKLRFNFDDRPYVEIDGIVENTPETDRFSESPTLPTMGVSIICPKPNFLSEFKSVSSWSSPGAVIPTDLHYQGTTGGGFFFEMELGDNAIESALYLISTLDGNVRSMRFNPFALAAGWKIHISTHLGARRAEFRPPEELEGIQDPISMLGYMEDTYFWTQLFPGVQEIEVRTPGTNVNRPWTLGYADQFAGV